VYIDELEKKVSSLIADNENISKQLATITGDKNKLQQEVIYLRGLLKQNSSLPASSPATSMVSSTTVKKTISPRNVKTAAVCLMVVMFSFGLLFRSDQFGNGNDRK
jgi:hypothetical protein